MKYATLAVVTILCLSGCNRDTVRAGGYDREKGTANTLASSDRDFLEATAKGSDAEADLGRLAQEKALNPSVRDFSGTVVQDHTEIAARARSLAGRYGVSIRPGPASENKGTLSKLSGNDFDKEFIKFMVEKHEKGVRDFQEKSTKADNMEVRDFAATTLPMLQGHLEAARHEQERLGMR